LLRRSDRCRLTLSGVPSAVKSGAVLDGMLLAIVLFLKK
jgi:hypothetical protein